MIPAGMKLIVLLRLVWLLPLTLAALFCLQLLAISVFYIFGPGAEPGARFWGMLYALFYSGIAYGAYRAWRTTVLALRGKAELSLKRSARAAAVTAALLLFFGFFAFEKTKSLMRYSITSRQKGELASVRIRLEEEKQARGAYPSDAAAVEALAAASSAEGLWKTKLNIYEHPPTNSVNYYPSFEARDTGAWAYVNAPASPDFGRFYIDCTHMDQERGYIWSSY